MTQIDAKIVPSEDGYHWVVIWYDDNVMDRIPCKTYEVAQKVQECVLHDRQIQQSSTKH